MKIYTYYEDIKFRNQEKLIDVWERSWRNQGFDPIVLSRSDAEKNNLFQEFEIKMQELHTEIMGKPVMGYGMSCYYRWLAYGGLADDEAFYVSDYDIINRSWSAREPINRLHLMDADCPCLASGTAKQMQRLCKLFLSVTEERLDYLRGKPQPWYHDQEFFTFNFTSAHNAKCSKLKMSEGIILTRDRDWMGATYDPKEGSTCELIHFSHYCIGQINKKYPEYREEEKDGSVQRVRFTNQYLNEV